MRKTLLIFTLSVSAGWLPVSAGAHGCIKGAALGGIAGHLVGHHAVAGAAVGCAIGHHRAKVKEKEAVRAQAAAKGNATEPSAAH
jgi:hypothetical protein